MVGHSSIWSQGSPTRAGEASPQVVTEAVRSKGYLGIQVGRQHSENLSAENRVLATRLKFRSKILCEASLHK